MYVALLNGHLQAFRFGEGVPPWPLVYRARASVYIQPTTAGEHVVWANDVGDISVIAMGRRGVRYRMRLPDHIAGPILFVPPHQILGVTMSGDLYSIELETGNLQWRYACGDATAQPASIIGNNVFLVTRERGMHVVSAATGERSWPSVFDSVRQFVAATTKHIYCTASLGQLIVLDVENGQIVGQIPLNLTDRVFTNNQTDRIYIATRHGALQCLRELGADVPTLHVTDASEEPDEPTESEAPDDATPALADPFATDDAPPEEPDARPSDGGDEADPLDPFGGS